MIKNVIEKIKAPFKGNLLEYGVIETNIFSQVDMGEDTSSFILATAGHYAEFAFAEYFNGKRSSKFGDTNDIYDSNGGGWEIRARSFRFNWNKRYDGGEIKRYVCPAIHFCGGHVGNHGGCSEEDHIKYVKAKFNEVDGIVIVDHQYLHKNGICRYWKIHSSQVLALFEEKLWKGKRKLDGTYGKVAQFKKAKSTQTFIATMSNIFQTEYKQDFLDFEFEDWLTEND
jgi:hypothetical protein